jgi:hypothetical protein
MKKRNSKATPKFDGPKILIFDIETSPVTSYIWSLRQKYIPIDMLKSNQFILCWAAKWLGSDEVIAQKLPDNKKLYKKNKEDDSKILEVLWKLLDEADMVVAHNAKRFDVPVVNGRFLFHGMKPPSPYKIIDTLIIARREFRLISNKLDYLGEYLGVGKKNKTDFDLWLGCMSGNKASWKEMMAYNVEDTLLLERVYLQLRAWDKMHPNFGLYVNDLKPMCAACGSDALIKKGTEKTQVGMYQRYTCKECGHPNRGRYTILPKDKRKTLLTNAV